MLCKWARIYLSYEYFRYEWNTFRRYLWHDFVILIPIRANSTITLLIDKKVLKQRISFAFIIYLWIWEYYPPGISYRHYLILSTCISKYTSRLSINNSLKTWKVCNPHTHHHRHRKWTKTLNFILFRHKRNEYHWLQSTINMMHCFHLPDQVTSKIPDMNQVSK